MLDFHVAIRWLLAVSQYFISVLYLHEQSSYHSKFLQGARLSCGHQVVLTCGIPILRQCPIFTWAILLPILAVPYQGMKYHKKCIRRLCTCNCNNVMKTRRKQEKPNRKNWILSSSFWNWTKVWIHSSNCTHFTTRGHFRWAWSIAWAAASSCHFNSCISLSLRLS